MALTPSDMQAHTVRSGRANQMQHPSRRSTGVGRFFGSRLEAALVLLRELVLHSLHSSLLWMACLLSEPAQLRPCQELKTENLGLALALAHEYSDCRWRPIFCVEIARHKHSGLMYLYLHASVWSQGCRFLMTSEISF